MKGPLRPRGSAACLLAAFLLTGCSLSQSRFAWQFGQDLDRIGQKQALGLEGEVSGPLPKVLSAEGKTARFDLYQPIQANPKASVLAVPGAAELGKDDPRLVAFAMALAKNGFLVAVPDPEGVKTLRVGPRDIQEIKESFRLLTLDPQFVTQGRWGIVAFSYAAGPALLASLEPDIREKVQFLILVGGYYDVVQVLRFTTTGFHEYRDRSERGGAHPYGKLVFLLAVEDLIEPADRDILRQIVEEVLKDPGVDLAPWIEKLGTEGKRIYELLMNRDPEKVTALLALLLPKVRERLQALSPSTYDLSHLRARVYLIHGRLDPAIPYTESLWLRDALKDYVPVRLTVLETLYHVDLGLERGVLNRLLDKWRIWWSLYHIAREITW